ncbi:DUF2384 domain-containing protein [Aquiflexum sp. TKW24L]|uniref:type II RES/Xre toxin-antitoxin system antitoxin n=1 Tax=Aquiflexum sp. TKW24L TaxID=2942212 RepID=UPI0020BE43BE|nr:antitoxin Xre/MbcA/ParS toxin-binding domain-containing protein [Aquiflexum sp. TKW24L]MCL6258802.1 DUF2384 domain-containing protein [Aquiflexum sp. TKW24L]
MTEEKRYKEISEIIGGVNFIGNLDSPMDFISIACEGVASYALNNFKEEFDLSLSQVASILSSSEPTLYRRIKSNQKLPKNDAIKLFEVTDLFLYGERIFGSKEDFFKWMELPNTALGGMKPMELIEVPEGVSKVFDLLGRIEYGVYS